MSQEVLGMLPMNISLLILTPRNLSGVKQIKVLDTMEGATKSFHPEGIYSTEIFGKAGDERRNRLYGYIDLGIEIFHPTIFKAIVELKELYGKIMSGGAYAVFDEKLKDFVPSNLKDGQTGFTFFMKHFPKLKFEERPSVSREFAIAMIEKHRDELTMDKLLVMPAGLRDYVVNDNGKPEEDEINDLYRRVLSISTIIKSQTRGGDHSHLDATRYSLQSAVMEIYFYILNIVAGKDKMVQGHWTSRNLHYSTRNVATSFVPKTKALFDDLSVDSNFSAVGLYQFLLGAFPLAGFHVRRYASQIFVEAGGYASLTDPKTLQRVSVRVSPKRYDEWMTQDGLEGTLGRFEIEALRHDAIEIDGYYFGLLYNDGEYVKFCQSKDELPEGKNPKHLSPITYAELYYLAVCQAAKDTPAFTTRYPVIELGSVYPTMTYLRTTTKSVVLKGLGEDWEPNGETFNEWPIRGEAFFNSIAVSGSHEARLGLDYDGDTLSWVPVLTEEGKADVRKLLNSREYYVSTDGGMNFSTSTLISDLVFAELTA